MSEVPTHRLEQDQVRDNNNNHYNSLCPTGVIQELPNVEKIRVKDSNYKKHIRRQI